MNELGRLPVRESYTQANEDMRKAVFAKIGSQFNPIPD